MSFAAVGATVGAVALLDWHWDLSLALLLAGAAAALVAAVVGIPTLRLDGMFAAVTTLAFSLAASGYLLVREEFSWIPQTQLGTPTSSASPSPRRRRSSNCAWASWCSCSSRCTACATAVPDACPARAARQPAGGVGLRRAGRVGEADRVRHLGVHRGAGRLPPRSW